MEVTIEKFNPWRDSLVIGVLLLILGILMVWFRSEALQWIIILAGAFLLVGGIVAVVDAMRTRFMPTLVMGALSAVLGIVFIVLNDIVEGVAMILVAVGLIVVGLVSFAGATGGFTVTRGGRVVSVIIGALLMVTGVFALFNLEDTADVVMILIGAVMILSGLLHLYQGYVLRRAS